jgi:limonene 1,2-monooxygenase
MVAESSFAPPVRFGCFYPPFQPQMANPTMQIRRDIKLMALLDDLGFDEVWCGEHHSGGAELISSPEMLIAAGAEHAPRIKFGTGVVSLPYHNPLMVANRLLQLDHQTRGRLIVGTGPGKLPMDARMLGIPSVEQRTRQGEALDVLVPLLRGEMVTHETSWFSLTDAHCQLHPYHAEGLELVAASTISPSGSVLAGERGMNLLSLAAGDKAGFNALDANWKAYEEVSAANGNTARRDDWRIVLPMFIGEDRADAERMIAHRVRHFVRYMEHNSAQEFAWGRDVKTAIQTLREDGWPGIGRAIVGGPEEAIEAIENVVQKTGGFGTVLLLDAEIMDWADTQRSYALFANEVIPHFRRSNRNRVMSMEYWRDNNPRLAADMSAAVDRASKEFYGEDHVVDLGLAATAAERELGAERGGVKS